ncbi:MAG TPA: hypothetical protein VFZ81_03015 [Burkholderiales bacterium]
MPRVAAFLALLLTAAGCTPMYWVRQDTGPEQLDRDMELCQRAAWREASWRASFYRPLGPTVIHDLHGRRLLVWPYSPFSDPFGDRFFEESRLAHFCMRAKGYELVPADKIQPSPEGTSSGKP